MTVRPEYARPRPRAIARHPGPSPAARAHRGKLPLQPAPGPAGAWHRRPPCGPRRWFPAGGAVAAGSGAGAVPVGVLWVTRRPSCVVGPLAAPDGGTSRDGAPAGSAASQPAHAGDTTRGGRHAPHPALPPPPPPRRRPRRPHRHASAGEDGLLDRPRTAARPVV